MSGSTGGRARGGAVCCCFRQGHSQRKCLTYRHFYFLCLLGQLKWISSDNFLSLLPFSTLVLSEGISGTISCYGDITLSPESLWEVAGRFFAEGKSKTCPSCVPEGMEAHEGLCYQDLVFTGLSMTPY